MANVTPKNPDKRRSTPRSLIIPYHDGAMERDVRYRRYRAAAARWGYPTLAGWARFHLDSAAAKRKEPKYDEDQKTALIREAQKVAEKEAREAQQRTEDQQFREDLLVKLERIADALEALGEPTP